MKFKKGDIIRDTNIVVQITDVTDTAYVLTQIGNDPDRIINLSVSADMVDQAENVRKYLDVLKDL